MASKLNTQLLLMFVTPVPDLSTDLTSLTDIWHFFRMHVKAGVVSPAFPVTRLVC